MWSQRNTTQGPSTYRWVGVMRVGNVLPEQEIGEEDVAVTSH